jgi:thioredoxin-related protein
MATFKTIQTQILTIATLMILSLLSACHSFHPVLVGVVQQEKDKFELRTLDDKPYSFEETIKNHDATVLFWWAIECPCVERFQKRIHALKEAYANDKVAFLAIASNVDDDAARIQMVAQKRQFQLPIVIDTHSLFANLLNIQTTPTVVLFDKKGNLVFKGWIDNERTANQAGRIAYLENAIKETLAHKPVTLERTPTYGCMITKSIK